VAAALLPDAQTEAETAKRELVETKLELADEPKQVRVSEETRRAPRRDVRTLRSSERQFGLRGLLINQQQED
jgi:hypothetical protein